MARNSWIMCAVVWCIVTLSPPVFAGDIWVAGAGSDVSPNDGSFGAPYRTISKAMQEASANDTIKVLTGVYSASIGESFPITVKEGVSILGQESDEEDYPEIGGDVQVSTVRSLLEVLATSSDRVDLTISKLRFVGEDTSGKDAPSAIYAENAGGYQLAVDIENCVIERSRMRASGATGRASIVGRAGAAEIVADPDASEFGLDISLFQCTIHPTDAGAIDIDVTDDATSPDRAFVNLVVDRCDISLTGSETASRAIDLSFDVFDDSSETGRIAELWTFLVGNTIDASGCTGDGILEGIRIGGVAKYGGAFASSKNNTQIVANDIIGMKDAALSFYLFADENSSSEVRSWHIDRNQFISGGGAGVRYEQGDTSAQVYTNLRYFNTIVAGNAGSGFVFDNLDDVENETTLINVTIAHNDRYGIEMIDSGQPGHLSRMENTIVWGNTLGSATGWDPSTDATTFSHSDYEGLFGGSPSCTADANGNVDSDPYFVNPSYGDFHLHPSSCVLAKGDNTPSYPLPYFDIDDESRFYARVDMGADEYHP